MDTATIWTILYGFSGGVAGYLVFHGVLALRIIRLQFAVVTLQGQLLSVRNTTRVQKRWNERDELEEEVVKAIKTPAAAGRRYDNDPLI